MKCKICELEKTHKEAFEEFSDAINRKLKMLSITKSINHKYGLNITPNNVSRHKSHSGSQVIEIKEENLKKIKKKSQTTVIKGENIRRIELAEQNGTSTSSFSLSFPKLEANHEKFLLAYRANGYKEKEKSYKEAGYKRSKGVYECLVSQTVSTKVQSGRGRCVLSDWRNT